MYCPYTTKTLKKYHNQMNPAELEIMDTTESNTSAPYLDLLLAIERNGG